MGGLSVAVRETRTVTDMEQIALIHEDIYEALRTCVAASGGPKRVAAVLWPEMPADKAANRLADALNVTRREILNPEQVVLLMRLGRQAGCHAGMTYLAAECGYEAKPIEPEDERARLEREFNASVKLQADLVRRMEALVKT